MQEAMSDPPVLPKDVDVLLGSSNEAKNHPGTLVLKNLVAERYDEYQRADRKTDVMDPSKRSREVINREIFDTILERGGRFLKRDTKTKQWYPVNLEQARAKISSSFKAQPPLSSPTMNIGVSPYTAADNHLARSISPAIAVPLAESAIAPNQLGASSESTPTERAEARRNGAMILTPRPHDVLSGRGSGVNDHVGNVRYRTIVQSRKGEYQSTNNRHEKNRIVHEVLERIREGGGDFLKQIDAADSDPTSSGQAGTWEFLAESVALEKIKQALRQKETTTLFSPALSPEVTTTVSTISSNPTHPSAAAGIPIIASAPVGVQPMSVPPSLPSHAMVMGEVEPTDQGVHSAIISARITQVGDFDVLVGQSIHEGSTALHSGNMFCSQLVSQYLMQLSSMQGSNSSVSDGDNTQGGNQASKDRVVDAVLEKIRGRGGRFLTRDMANPSAWLEVDNSMARQKVEEIFGVEERKLQEKSSAPVIHGVRITENQQQDLMPTPLAEPPSNGVDKRMELPPKAMMVTSAAAPLPAPAEVQVKLNSQGELSLPSVAPSLLEDVMSLSAVSDQFTHMYLDDPSTAANSRNRSGSFHKPSRIRLSSTSSQMSLMSNANGSIAMASRGAASSTMSVNTFEASLYDGQSTVNAGSIFSAGTQNTRKSFFSRLSFGGSNRNNTNTSATFNPNTSNRNDNNAKNTQGMFRPPGRSLDQFFDQTRSASLDDDDDALDADDSSIDVSSV